MNTLIKATKTNTYINFNGTIFQVVKNPETIQFNQVSEEIIEERNLNNPTNWANVGEHSNMLAAYNYHLELELQARKQRQLKNAAVEQQQAAAWDAIKNLEVIPSTLENIHLLLTHLNKSNWGSWNLPKMSIGYTVNQYDCDGSPATTIKLVQPVNGNTMYKVGGKFGHLTKYKSL